MLAAFHIAAKSRAEAHAIQQFLSRLSIAALSGVATTVIDGQSFVSSIAYDNQGRSKHAEYPQVTGAATPLALTTDYNASGYANEVKHATTGQSYWKIDVDGRDDDGQLKLAALGGILTPNPSYSGDGLGRISTINVTSGANPLLAQTFDFESAQVLENSSTNNPA